MLEAKDVGIDEFRISCGSPSASPNENKGMICGLDVSEITYIHIHECRDFSVSSNFLNLLQAQEFRPCAAQQIG